ncbi:UDP-forming cellulose synthase catalytic subunit [Sediminicoccus sp. KRV36]|uniref:UDP-forming cellulose synthase catalytic subunit n=1 Tax=Sediminicoccus sp. KRV36 TaxID=3133721 RepID=UPI00200CE372|nr:UDP-forming cellulose synthase catalytic subunit [Sediminicoccus rosea]UPY37750.1 UDP-forming cellulose synthase catalytic subunit [Sediminicoccus rosea]
MSGARFSEYVQTFPGEAPFASRVQRLLAVTLGLLGAFFFITVPMEEEGQVWLTLGGIAMFMILNRNKSRKMGLILVVLSVMVTSRYLFWRATETLEFETVLQSILGTLLFGAEMFAGTLMTLSYIQTSYPLDRKPVPMPINPDVWPTVDIYVPSYNETLDLVRPTVLAAMNMDYPRDKLNVWILDDGRRPEFRDFAEECGCGYIIRPDNKGAKAGNLNHAMRHTTGEYIAIFDCDHAPTRAFLQLTLGWLIRDRRIALVQTPHHFYSPDPFERNLVRQRLVPNEGLLFYGAIQPGSDLWNASFFCGSCAVIRREALEEVGGVPHVTVTEDCHCALKMQQRGWHTAYIRIPLAAGLATERLALHIGQRLRWARGMLQIMRTENTLFAPGLKWMQRFCYFIAGFGFLFALPRVIFLTSPLAFLFFGESVIAASPVAIIAYAGSHMFHAIATTARLNGKHRHSFWSEIYEASLAVPLLPVTVLTLWDPSKGKFNVTDKGGILEAGYLDFRAVLPNLIMLALLSVGFAIGIWGSFTSDLGSLEGRAYLLNTIWAGLCLIPLAGSVAVGREREQSRVRARVEANLPGELILASGERLPTRSANLSLSGARLIIDRALGVAEGDEVQVAFETGGEIVALRAHVIRWDGNEVYLEFIIETLADEASVVRAFFGRPDAWLYWDHWPEDKPLRSLWTVVLASADAVFRKYRFGILRSAKPVAGLAKPQAPRVSDVVAPRRPNTAPPAAMPPPTAPRPVPAATAALLALGLFCGMPAGAQPIGAQPAGVPPGSAQPGAVQPSVAQSGTAQPGMAQPGFAAPQPPALPAPVLPSAMDAEGLPPGARIVTRTLKEMGLTGPMQLRGTNDLQGVLFGLRADEVVTQARVTVAGGASPALIPSLSQIALTLNDQFVGTIPMDAARQSFGPLEFPLDPLYFSEVNRLNFRFAGRYTTECNDALSGLLWATVSDLSTLQLRIERLPPSRDLSRLPEPIFDRRVLSGVVTVPMVLPEALGPAGLRAAAIAASWFSVQADYRGASFPVSRALPERGDAVVLAMGVDAVPGLTMPRVDGPTLALLPNPTDPFGTLLVIAGRSEADLVAAAQAMVAGRATLAGEIARVVPPTIPARQPYDSPRWIRTDQPVTFGSLIARDDLQSAGYAPGPIRIPVRTAPDLLTWRNRGFPVHVEYRSPAGPVIDVATSRLDAAFSGAYLRSFRLADPEWIPPLTAAADWLAEQLGFASATRSGRFVIPHYLVLGRDELQLRFDMRPLARGDCVAVPADVRAAIEPGSTVDLRRGYRYARMPNLGFFASSGFPFTRMADLSGTAVVLPERANPLELGAFLDVVGQLAATAGLASTGIQVVTPAGLASVAGRDLLVLGTLGRQPALGTLFRDTPIRIEADRLTLTAPDALQDIRSLFLDAPGSAERGRAATVLNEGSGEGLAALLGGESPLQAGRSVVAITGVTPAAIGQMVAALADPALAPRIQGDLAVLSGGRMESFRTASPYAVGSLPWWVRPQVWLAERPERMLMLMLGAAALIGVPFFWMLRRRSLSRLRARTNS